MPNGSDKNKNTNKIATAMTNLKKERIKERHTGKREWLRENSMK